MAAIAAFCPGNRPKVYEVGTSNAWHISFELHKPALGGHWGAETWRTHWQEPTDQVENPAKVGSGHRGLRRPRASSEVCAASRSSKSAENCDRLRHPPRKSIHLPRYLDRLSSCVALCIAGRMSGLGDILHKIRDMTADSAMPGQVHVMPDIGRVGLPEKVALSSSNGIALP